MKALILAGGRGTRLDAFSKGINKCMIKVLDKHVLEFNLDSAVNTTIGEIIIVVGYRAEEIINRFGIEYRGKPIRYVIQWEQKGLVHAIECAREALCGDDFMLMLGDEILINPRHQEMIDHFHSGGATAICGILQVQDKELIKRTYTIIQGEDGRIFRLIEKPRQPLNSFMGTGDCVFKHEILDYIDFTPIHHERKEKELPDLIQSLIDDGKIAKSFIICDKYTNINTEDDVRQAEAYLRGNQL